MTTVKLFLLIFYIVTKELNAESSLNNQYPQEIVKQLTSIFGVNIEALKDPKINELLEKIDRINNYVVDKETYQDLLLNETKLKDDKSFLYKNILEEDSLKFLTDNKTKSLFASLKDKMNRDDILRMLSEKSGAVNDGRRSLKGDPQGIDDAVEDIIDEVLAQPVRENKPKKSKIQFWQPEIEAKQVISSDSRRLYHGEETNIKKYPFMVSVHVMGRFWCGGSIIYSDLVLTSAACLQLLHNNRFYRENPRVVQVRVKSNYSIIGGSFIDALEVYFYPGYQPRTLKHNIALIRLRDHVKLYKRKSPRAIRISDNDSPVPINMLVTVLGWGVTKESQKTPYKPMYLQKKVLSVYPNIFCKESYGEKFIIPSMFCAGTITTGEGACELDAGGPAIFGGHLVGIISFAAKKCGERGSPTVFTHVGMYGDWIRQVNASIPEYKRKATKRPRYNYDLQPMMTHPPITRSTKYVPTNATTTMKTTKTTTAESTTESSRTTITRRTTERSRRQTSKKHKKQNKDRRNQ